LTAPGTHDRLYCEHANGASSGVLTMIEKTCAACDCKLDDHVIKVKLGGKTVEVCCDECAQKLREAHGASAAP
jgi:hypothetical protein